MKKTLSFLTIVLIFFSSFAIGPVKQTESHFFDSIPMLDAFYKEEEAVSSYWDKVKVSLITISKGDPLYSWFGHTGMLVEYPSGTGALYDYGRFAFSTDFYINFVKGQLWFGCGGFYANEQFEVFKSENRSISKIELSLTSSQKKAICDFLNTNSNDPYNRYLYHHYKDNCATRIRDIINYATGGDFEEWAKQQSGYTFREQTSRVLHNKMLIEWVLDLLQGPSIDGDATLWDEMFLPENLEKAILEYGKVTKEHTYIYDSRETDTRETNYVEAQSYVFQSLFVGLGLGLLAILLGMVWKPGYITETSIVNFILALLGSIMFYMMFFSDHSFSWNNENILFINPLLLVPFVCGFKPKKNARILTISYGTLSAITAIVLAIKMFAPQTLEQANLPQLVAVLPYYFANFIVCLKEVYSND